MAECKSCGAQLEDGANVRQWVCSYCKKLNYNNDVSQENLNDYDGQSQICSDGVDSAKAESLLQAGIIAYESEEYEVARSTLERALAEDSNLRDAWLYCALSIAHLSEVPNVEKSLSSVTSCLKKAKALVGDPGQFAVAERSALNAIGKTILRKVRRHRSEGENRYLALVSNDRAKANSSRDEEFRQLFQAASTALKSGMDDPTTRGEIAIEALLAAFKCTPPKGLTPMVSEALSELRSKNPEYYDSLPLMTRFQLKLGGASENPAANLAVAALLTFGIVALLFFVAHFAFSSSTPSASTSPDEESRTQQVRHRMEKLEDRWEALRNSSQAQVEREDDIPDVSVSSAEAPVEDSENLEWDELMGMIKSDIVLTPGVELIDASRRKVALPPGIKSVASESENAFKASFLQNGRSQYVFCTERKENEDGDLVAEFLVAEEDGGKLTILYQKDAVIPQLQFAGDIDGDGRIEVIAFDYYGGSSGGGSTYVLSFADGSPEFIPLHNDSTVSDSGVLSVLDIDGDEVYDLVVPTESISVGANASREYWYDVLNWQGKSARSVTSSFEDFYSRTFVRYWQALGKGDSDEARNCRILLALFRNKFTPNVLSVGQEGAESRTGTAILTAENSLIKDPSGNLVVQVLSDIQVGKPFDVVISMGNELDAEMHGTISISLPSGAIDINPVSASGNLYPKGSSLLSAESKGASFKKIVSKTPVIESYFPVIKTLERKTLIVTVDVREPGDYRFLARATLTELTKEFKVGLNSPETGVPDQQGFPCMEFTISVR